MFDLVSRMFSVTVAGGTVSERIPEEFTEYVLVAGPDPGVVVQPEKIKATTTRTPAMIQTGLIMKPLYAGRQRRLFSRSRENFSW